jgi:hypothetical protein
LMSVSDVVFSALMGLLLVLVIPRAKPEPAVYA